MIGKKRLLQAAFLMGWVVRVELTTSRATIWRPNQLGHTHHIYVARQERLELPTYCLEGSCSIQLSYWRIFNGAGDGNRTHATSLEGWNSTIELHPQVSFFVSVLTTIVIISYFYRNVNTFLKKTSNIFSCLKYRITKGFSGTYFAPF